jgi:DNA-binding NarL/FixJ family response regulator
MADRQLVTPSGAPITLCDDDVALIELVADGLTLEAMSRRCGVSERTLRRRIRGLCQQVGVEAPIQVAVWAARRGVI